MPKHLLGGVAASELNRPKPNSTSSLYILSTLQNPNQDELVKCVAISLHNRVKEGHLEQYKPRTEDEIFNELLHPINNDKVDAKKVPQFDVVFDFLNSIYRAERLAPECLVMVLAYIDRMLQVREREREGLCFWISSRSSFRLSCAVDAAANARDQLA